SPFAAMLLSPHPFRVEVSGRAVAQSVRRCITHLLPVRPTYVGRTDLTSQGAPKRVPFGASSDMHVLGAADSRFLLCSFYDGRVVKLDLPSGKVVAELKATTKGQRFYSHWALSSDGRFLPGNVYTMPPFRQGGNLPEDWQEVPPPEIHIWETSKLMRLETLT